MANSNTNICSVEGCNARASVRDLCGAHYARVRRTGSLGDSIPVSKQRGWTPPVCSVAGCENRASAHGFCTGHWERCKAHGDPQADKPLRRWGEQADWLKAHVSFSGDECLIWPYTIVGRRSSYTSFNLMVDGRRLSGAHLAMCWLAHGPKPTQQHEAAHSCGKGHEGCVNPMHLRWATHVENVADMTAAGTQSRGAHHPLAILNEDDVREIRRLLPIVPYKLIGEIFGVSKNTVRSIARRQTWTWLP